ALVPQWLVSSSRGRYACRSLEGGLLFQSAAYLVVFLICVAVLAKFAAPRVRQSLLLLASYALYLTWSGWFIAVLLFSVVINFFLGQWLRRNRAPSRLWVG